MFTRVRNLSGGQTNLARPRISFLSFFPITVYLWMPPLLYLKKEEDQGGLKRKIKGWLLFKKIKQKSHLLETNHIVIFPGTVNIY